MKEIPTQGELQLTPGKTKTRIYTCTHEAGQSQTGIQALMGNISFWGGKRSSGFEMKLGESLSRLRNWGPLTYAL